MHPCLRGGVWLRSFKNRTPLHLIKGVCPMSEQEERGVDAAMRRLISKGTAETIVGGDQLD